MKRFLITGFVIILAVFLVTCDALFPDADDDDEITYTDVEYSEGGSVVKVWIDGSKPVPVTKRSLRAMSTDLSRMAYDYLEVIFKSGSTIARSQWELGESAGISGIVRTTGTGTPAPDYKWVSAATDNYALMAVGTKDGKTLLGVGAINSVDGSTYTATPANIYIYATTQYVTFYLLSVKTGLIVSGESKLSGDPPAGNPVGALVDSFPGSSANFGSVRSDIGDLQVPIYSFTDTQILAGTASATYTFEGAVDTAFFGNDLIFSDTSKPITAERRVPRYMVDGRYKIAKGMVNTRTKVTVSSTYTSTTMTKNVVPLDFTIVGGKGIFSFYLDMPVFLKSAAPSTNSGTLNPIAWHVRTGFGSELYSLDDGGASGGCVLMGIGVTSLDDWLEITWDWLP